MYSIYLTVVGALVALFVGQAAYNLFLSPLRKIPGPFLAKITPYWIIFVDLAGCRTRTLHDLHVKYGHSVRIGPGEVSYSNPEIIKELYGLQTNFMKAPIYESFSVPPMGIFSMRGKKEHSQRRRLLSHAFSQSNLLDTEPLIKEHVRTFLGIMASKVGQSVNMLTLFRKLSFDIVGELFLGQSFKGLEQEGTPQFLHDMDALFLLQGVKKDFPLIYYFFAYLPVPAVSHFFGSTRRLIQYGKDAFYAYISQYGRNSGRRDLLTKVLVSKSDDGAAPLTDLEIYTEVGNLVFAGTDTTSTTLTYLFWLLAKHPEWADRIRQEVEKAGPFDDDIPNYKGIIDLPILEAVITEALRLYPAAPASLPRETPAGGATLNGVFVPEKTVVSMQCYTTQRDGTVFPDPEAFRPQRWLDEKAITPEMKTMLMPFSTGTRVCLGINLAWMELKVITVATLMKYTVHLAPGTTDEGMQMLDHFLALPKAGKCELIFQKVQAA